MSGNGNYVTAVGLPTGVPATDTAAIQNVIGGGGKAVLLQAGNYVINQLTVHNGTRLVGAGVGVTTLTHSADTDAIVGVDLTNLEVSNLTLNGPGRTASPSVGSGINFTLSGGARNATFYVKLADIFVTGFGKDGIAVQAPVASEFDKVLAFQNGRHGINLWSTGGADGTSSVLNACYAAGNYGAGHRLSQIAYSSLNGCAADSNGIQYEYATCIGITESGCGSEEPYDFSVHQTGYVGYSRKIFNSKVVLNSPYSIGNIGTAYWVTNGSQVVANCPYDGSHGNTDSPINSPTNSWLVDSGCTVVLIDPIHEDALNRATGTTTVLPDAFSSGGAPVTNQGDLSGYSTSAAGIAVGSDGQVLNADSGATPGLSYQNPWPLLVPTGSTYYMHDAFGGAFAENQTTVNDNGYFTPILVRKTTTFDRICLRITTAGTAGALMRAGIWADSGGGIPAHSAPILDAGTVAATGTGDTTWTISQQLTPGLYHLCFKPEGGAATPAKPQGYTSMMGGAAQTSGLAAAGMLWTFAGDGTFTSITGDTSQASFRPVGSLRVASRP